MRRGPVLRVAMVCLGWCAACFAVLGGGAEGMAAEPGQLGVRPLRPPSVPLITHDPYFSIWSPHDRLPDGDTTHWTGKKHRLNAMIRIDGKAYRLMGSEPSDVVPLPQSGLTITPTRTSYAFDHESLSVTFTFLTPALPDDLDVLSRPATYLTIEVVPKGNAPPDVQLYLDAHAELAVNTRDQVVQVEALSTPDLQILKVGSVAQPVLKRRGDDVRIDWGYFYLAARRDDCRAAIVVGPESRARFAAEGDLPSSLIAPPPGPAAEAPVLALSWRLGSLADRPASATAIVAYDDILSIRYFDADLGAYWRRNGADAATMLSLAAAQQTDLARRCREFDRALLADAEKVGGAGYAQLVALCHRQSLAGTKLVADASGQPLFFAKENHSNGCIATVDVFYPQSPHLLLLSPALIKATLVPMLDYASSPRWKFDFAPHDLGKYPHATGQVYGGGEKTVDRQMMVEESANMLLMVSAVARLDGDASFFAKYWPLLTKWAVYLEKNGYDPENQLCTDDFAGHLARNVNLSAKAICALAAYARLAETAGKRDVVERYGTLARELAARWTREADDGGTHTRLAFDRAGTWSQKYNLAWNRVLELGLFPDAVMDREIAHYRKVSNPYGLPLDSRSTYTKLDWILWTASLAKRPEDFRALVDPVLKFIQETPDRSPLTDWYFTDTPKKRGFTARPVIGGVFMPMLTDAEIWRRWSARGAGARGPWAPFPWKPAAGAAAAKGQ